MPIECKTIFLSTKITKILFDKNLIKTNFSNMHKNWFSSMDPCMNFNQYNFKVVFLFTMNLHIHKNINSEKPVVTQARLPFLT